MLAPLDGQRAEERELLELTRSEDLHVINNVAAAARVSLIYAMSGNGKTSLINAGVIPFFRQHGHAVFTTRPRPPVARHDPRRAFRECILEQLTEAVRAAHDADALKSLDDFIQTTQRTELKSFADRFRMFAQTTPADPAIARAVQDRMAQVTSAPLPEFMHAVADLVGPQRPILVICDQFEELFVHFANELALQQYVEDLGAVCADNELNVRLLFSMREDWVGSMIAFRRVIPDIFKDTFRLQPLTTTRARHVLTAPLESRGYRFAEDAADVVLNDLAFAYDRVEKRRLGSIEPDDAEPEVRFVELPAVHLVASKLWETRNHAKPFSVDHYRSLPVAEAEEGTLSPAATVVENFLNDALSRKESERVLQVDTLYLLTDGERHRRASSAESIARALKRVRPSQLFASQPSVVEIGEVVAPLTAKGLVRCLEGPEGLEYELGHDYAVRTVVRKWRDLDRARAKELGKLARDQEQKELRLDELEEKNDRVRHLLQIAPLVGLIGLAWAAFSLMAANMNAMRFDVAAPGPGLLIFVAYLVLLVAGTITRHQLSMVIATIGLLVAVSAALTVESRRRADQSKLVLASAQIRKLYTVHPSPELLQLAESVGKETSARAAWLRVIPSDFENTPVYAELSAIESSLYTRKLEYEGLSLALVALLILILWIRSLAQLQSAPRRKRFFALMWAELIDILLAIGVGWGALVAATQFGILNTATIIIAVTAIVAIRAVCLVKMQSTFGLTWIGLSLRHADGRPIAPFRAVARELLFAIWAVANVFFLLPWLIVSSLVCWFKGRTLPDLVARLEVVPSAALQRSREAPTVRTSDDARESAT
jgi:hypothetical protein